MNLTSEEWLDIEDWLSVLCAEYDEKAQIHENYRLGKFYAEEVNKIKAFLESKRS